MSWWVYFVVGYATCFLGFVISRSFPLYLFPFSSSKTTKPDLIDTLVQAFRVMSDHLGNTRTVGGELKDGEWMVFVKCADCSRMNRLVRGVENASCGACHKPFHSVQDQKSGPSELVN